MKFHLSRGLKEELAVAAVNALAISAFVGFMSIYPHYVDSWPGVYFDRIAAQFLAVVARFVFFVFLIELVPLFLLRRLAGESWVFVFRVLLPSFLDAILFGAVMGCLSFFGSLPGEAWTGPEIQYAQGIFVLMFWLHFIAVFVIEFIVRSTAFFEFGDRAPKKKSL